MVGIADRARALRTFVAAPSLFGKSIGLASATACVPVWRRTVDVVTQRLVSPVRPGTQLCLIDSPHAAEQSNSASDGKHSDAHGMQSMSRGSSAFVLFVSVAIGVWLLSFIVEALRRAPQAPRDLRWAPDIAIDYVTVDGYRLRYIRAGRGPNLLLLHTLRTQLDLFEKIVAELARDFTVYALDYPGHGYSDIPKKRYDADFF